MSGWFPKTSHENAVDSGELFCLARFEFFAAFTSSIGFAEGKTVFAKFQSNDFSHSTGVVGIVALGHNFGWNDTILADDVLHAGEGAAVADGIAEQPLHGEIAHRFVGFVDHRLQEKVSFFELVVERVVAL